ncbi:MAG: GrpB family protein [Actinobacteria bacterium]|nr:GrpB family protein [Actinomycetota bacterium]
MAEDEGEPIELRQVTDLTDLARRETDRLRSLVQHELGMSTVETVAFGATSYPDGVTKGDIDVLLRVPPERFGELVERLAEMMAVAQPDNWDTTFASFTDTSSSTPVGVQVTAVGSSHDRDFERQRRLLSDPRFRASYDRVKLRSAHLGADGYWQAKNAFWQRHALDVVDEDDVR